MTILVTGSSGWLGRHLIQRLKKQGETVVGLDPVPSEWTDVVGSVADVKTIQELFETYAIRGVIHCGALHKPDIARYPQQAFVDTNITGTLNLLEVSSLRNIPFVFTSTTSLMISQAIRDEQTDSAIWLNENHSPLAPRNIYGVTKLCAEHLCWQHHLTRGLNVVILRTARFFPEEDDTHHALSGPNMKLNELLNRRATVDDMARAHIMALNRASDLGFGLYMVSAPTPFSKSDCKTLARDAPSVIRAYFPDVDRIYRSVDWELPQKLGRIYDGSRIVRDLGFNYETDFARALASLETGDISALKHDASYISPLLSSHA